MAGEHAAGQLRGLMMETPLLVGAIARHAERLYATREIVGVTAAGIERSSWGQVVARARRLASALAQLGIGPGDRVATFATNSIRHLELYLAVPAMGAVLHTLNIRLFEDDLRYIVDHAEDRMVFLDASLAAVMPHFASLEHEVLLPDAADPRPGALEYEELLAGGDPAFEFPEFDEHSAAAMCYTSGTTGRPKGVVYSHRSTVLHALLISQPNVFGIRERDVVLPVVPMFHACAWGFPYAAALAGAKLVLPGPHTQGRELAELIDSEAVTIAAGVPTIWLGLLALEPAPALSSLEQLLCGGAPVPAALMRAYQERYGLELAQGWGMTETSPVATSGVLPPDLTDPELTLRLRGANGRPLPLIDVRIDPEAGGELQVRGPTVASAYYRDERSRERFTADGWLRTGDVAEAIERGFISLIDRTKDLVKSGGEWISSVALENEIMAHPEVLEAAVVAAADRRWGERPYAYVVRRRDSQLDARALRAFLVGRVASWWLPDRFEFVAEIPKTSVGKFDKRELRARLADRGLAEDGPATGTGGP